MKLNVRRTVLVGFAFFLICAFWQAYDKIVPLILTNKYGTSQLFSGVVMALDNVFALFMLPLFGKISDRISTPFGRRTPFILPGTVVAVIALSLFGVVDALWAFILLLLVALVAMATFRSPAVALMPDVTPKPLRSKANAVINLMGTAGGIAVLGIGIVIKTDTASGYTPYVLTVGGVMLIALGIFILTVREPKWAAEADGTEEASSAAPTDGGKLPKPELRSLLFILASVALWFFGYNAVTSKYSVYAQDFLGVEYDVTMLIAQGAAIVSYIPVGILATKIGRKKTIHLGIGLLFAAFFAASFLREGVPAGLMFALFALAGIGWATINVNSFPMVVELASRGNVGKYTGYYYTASMAAQIATPVLSGGLVDLFGWEVLFPYAAAFVALSFVTMALVRHGDAKPMPKESVLEHIGGED